MFGPVVSGKYYHHPVFLSLDCEFKKETEHEEQGSDEEFSCDKLGSYQESPKVTTQYKKDAVAFRRSGKRNKGRAFESLRKKFKLTPNVRALYKWVKQIAKGRFLAEKLEKYSKVCKEKFDAAYETQTIHMNIQQWAIQAAHAIGLENFKVSDT